MGAIRTLGSVKATAGTPTPILFAASNYPGTVIAATSFSVKNGIATIVLGSALPSNGYNGPDPGLQGSLTPAGGQQVTLWGFSTATYFNGKKITVLFNNSAAPSFSFYFNHADVSSTNDAGNTAPSPFQHYRAVRLECGQGLNADLIYVGDLNVSSTRYMAALSLAGQMVTEFVGDNIPAENIFIDTNGSSSGDTLQVSVIY